MFLSFNCLKTVGIPAIVKQWFAATGVLVSGVDCGCAVGYASVLLHQLNLEYTYTNTDIDSTSWIVSAITFLIIPGMIAASYVSTYYGRKITLIIACLPNIISWLIFFFRNNVGLFILARTLQGFGIGLKLVDSFMFLSEIASLKYKEAFIGSWPLSCSLGILFAQVLGFYASWHAIAIICSLFPLLSVIILTLSPKSPVWLTSKDDSVEAIRGLVEEKDLAISLQQPPKHLFTFEPLSKVIVDHLGKFKQESFQRSIIVATLLSIICEYAGNTYIPSYTFQLLEELTSNKLYFPSLVACINVARIFGVLTTIAILGPNMNKHIYCCGGLSVTFHFIIATFDCFKGLFFINDQILTDVLLSFLIVLFVYFNSICSSMCVIHIARDVFGSEHLQFGHSLSIAVNSAFMFVVTKIAPYVLEGWGLEGMLIFFALVLCCVLIVLYEVNKTRS